MNGESKKSATISEIVEKTLHEIDELKSKRCRYKPQFSRPLRGRWPFNPVTRRKYSGWNAFLLLHLDYKNGYGDHRWLTSAQINRIWEIEGKPRNLPIHVKKRETATYIVRPQIDEMDSRLKRSRGDEGWVDESYLKDLEEPPVVHHPNSPDTFYFYPVFNASQAENFPAFAEAGFKNKAERNTALDNFIASSGIKVRHVYDAINPFYDLEKDVIVMPYPKAYEKNPDAYYADKMHEFFHATGHPKRENRDMELLDEEEISAELFSIMAGIMLELPFPKRNAVGYLLPYHKAAIKSGRRGIPELTQQPAKILMLLDDFIGGQELPLSWFPDRRQWKKLQKAQRDSDEGLWSKE